jgi:uncharacterized protein (DUF2141 family)
MGCGKQPTYTDNGNPGQIKVTVFYDDNRNGTMDRGETGAPVEVGISQDISCPPSNQYKNTYSGTDADGVALFENLEPGKYCVGLNGNYSNTTRMNLEVYVSSDLRAVVSFGIARGP